RSPGHYLAPRPPAVYPGDTDPLHRRGRLVSADFQRDYLVRLPLPLAQLYARAHNAPSPVSRHNNTYYLFEAVVRLAAAAGVAAYADGLRRGDPPDPHLARFLAALRRPSAGNWRDLLRELARHFAARPDAASHPFGRLWDQLTTKRPDRP